MERLSSAPFSNNRLSATIRSPGFGLPRKPGSNSFTKVRNLSRNFSVFMFELVFENFPAKLSPPEPAHTFRDACVEDLGIE